jgi:glutamate-1-semialdehyde 2,1-aminomutase
MNNRYKNSETWLERARKVIPLGTQTYSKSYKQYPIGVSPLFVSDAKCLLGCRLSDIDGNEYLDFVMGLCAVNLGYEDWDVRKAVADHAYCLPTASLPSKLEVLVAEKIIEMVPCAEMARFAKNGSDATAGAVRLARAITGRDYIVKCRGHYHGCQDFNLVGMNELGVPEAVKKLTLHFSYNDLDSLHEVFRQHPDEIACVIMEPMNREFPKPGFLDKCQELAHKNGALFILDEIVTGFRFAPGGAQEYFGVIPDLCCLGKGMANGFPLSAVAGKAEYMRRFEDVHFSYTFGGECLSLAAAYATLNKIQQGKVAEYLYKIGQLLKSQIDSLIFTCDMEDIVTISGHPAWTFLNFRPCNGYDDYEIKTFFLQEAFARGILTTGTHNMCYAHGEKEVDRLIEVYKEVLPLTKEAVEKKRLRELLKCDPAKPAFKVR